MTPLPSPLLVSLRLKVLPALGAFFVSAALLAACGGGVPGNAVATVDGTPITKDDFNHWLGIAARSSQQAPGAKAAVAPLPPNFTACIAAKRLQLPKPAQGQPKISDTQIKAQCQSEFDMLRDQVMQLLISSQWIEQQASDLGIQASDADVQKQFQKTKKQAFPNEADYKKFLAQSGQSEQDILFRVRVDYLSNKIRAKITKGKDQVTDAQVAAYFAKNKSQYAQPEKRDINVILTKTKAQAERAKAAVQGGQSWAAAAKRYSTDPQSKNTGGQLKGVTKGQQDRALDSAAFTAQKGKIGGPVKGSFGWYIFQVTNITPGRQQTLTEVKPSIRQLLVSQGQQKALNTFVTDFQKRWQGKTDCREGYVVQSCKNAPKPKATTGQVPGQAPQPGQQAPQQGQTPQQQTPQQQAPQQQAPQQQAPQQQAPQQQAPPPSQAPSP